MNNQLLLPARYKRIGWLIFIPSLVVGICKMAGFIPELYVHVLSIFPGLFEKKSFQWIPVDLSNTIIGACFIIGSLLVGFSKEKYEDEYISSLRLSSLLWAVFVNYILLLIAFLIIYDTAFFSVMIYNMFTVLLIFIIRFNYMLFKSKAVPDESVRSPSDRNE